MTRSVVLVLLSAACIGGVLASQASAATVPVHESVCIAGAPWIANGRAGCEPSAPSISDQGRPIQVITTPGYSYIVEQTYTVSHAGGEYLQGADSIVQMRRENGRAPQYVRCVSEAATPDCSQISDPGLFEAQGAAISPDEQDVYVVSQVGISRFQLEAGTGALSFRECVGLEEEPCTAPTYTMNSGQTAQIVISPDGKDLYATTEGRLRDFHIGSGGRLQRGECYRFRSACSSAGPYETYGMPAITPDGSTVLSVFSDDHVNVYRREGDGSLRFVSCLAAGGGECPNVGRSAQALFDLKSIVVAPDGHDVYVTGGGSEAGPSTLAHLKLTSADTLEFVGCLAVHVSGCEELPAQVQPFSNADRAGKRLAITPNGAKLIMSGATALVVYKIAPATGDLTWEGCAGKEPLCNAAGFEGIGPQGGSVDIASNSSEVWASDAATARLFSLEFAAPVSNEALPVPGSVAASVGQPGYAHFEAWVQPHESATDTFFEVESTNHALTYRPTIRNETNSAGEQHFEGEASLESNASYRVRTVSVNEAGAGYGPWSSFTTEACGPEGEEPTQNGSTELSISATSLAVQGGVSPGCLSTSLTLEYGLTGAYGHSVAAPSGSLPLTYRNVPYRLEATELKPGTVYYYRLVASNRKGTHVLDADSGRTPPAVPPAVELDATSESTSVGDQGEATLLGSVTAGDTSVSTRAEIFEDSQTNEPALAIPLAELTPGREAVQLRHTVTGLECGKAYYWRLIAIAPYGESAGEQEPFTIPCSAGFEGTEAGEGAEGAKGAGGGTGVDGAGGGEAASGVEPPVSTIVAGTALLSESPGNFTQAQQNTAATPPASSSASLERPSSSTPAAGALRIVGFTIHRRADLPTLARVWCEARVRESATSRIELLPPRGSHAHPIKLDVRRVTLVGGRQLLDFPLDAAYALRRYRGWALTLQLTTADGLTLVQRLA
jgi:hypothetical protein